MEDETPDYTRFSTKELLALFILPRLDTIDGKLDSKASAQFVATLDSRILELERNGSPRVLDLEKRVEGLHNKVGLLVPAVVVDRAVQRVDSLVAWRNRIAGALTIVAVFAGTAFALAMKHLGV